MISIKSYTENLHQKVVDLILQIQQEEFEVAISYKDQPDLHNIKDFYFKDNGHFWVAEDEGKIIGTIGLIDIGNSAGILSRIYVSKEYRGKQVANMLMKQLENHSLNNSVEDIYLGTTSKFGAAYKFFQKSG